MHALMHLFEDEWTTAQSIPDKFLVASLGAYCIICFCGSFCGPEVFLVDLFGLSKYLDTPHRSMNVHMSSSPYLAKSKMNMVNDTI